MVSEERETIDRKGDIKRMGGWILLEGVREGEREVISEREHLRARILP